MPPCTETALLYAQLVFWAGVLAIFLKTLSRVRFNVVRAFGTMTGFNGESRERTENILGLVTIVATIVLFLYLNGTCVSI
ncbi:MAG: hypothetical protein MK098_11965 [Marinovum sp.]|nr:hypothetical protein [Marinovum sp.]